MERTAYTILHEHYTRDPERVCLHLLQAGQPDHPVTYRELMQSAAGWAQVYQRHGLQQGEVVILILPHGMDLIGAFWGAILHGAIPSIMPFLTEKLLPERYRKDLAALFSVTRPAAVVTYPDFEGEVRANIANGRW
jgi:fatty-acyl-CoA synthase